MRTSTAGLSLLLVSLGVWQLFGIWWAAITLGLMDWITDIINGILYVREKESEAAARREEVRQ